MKDHLSVIESSDIIFNENQFNTVDGASWLFDHEKWIKSFKIYPEDFDETFYKTSEVELNKKKPLDLEKLWKKVARKEKEYTFVKSPSSNINEHEMIVNNQDSPNVQNDHV